MPRSRCNFSKSARSFVCSTWSRPTASRRGSAFGIEHHGARDVHALALAGARPTGSLSCRSSDRPISCMTCSTFGRIALPAMPWILKGSAIVRPMVKCGGWR